MQMWRRLLQITLYAIPTIILIDFWWYIIEILCWHFSLRIPIIASPIYGAHIYSLIASIVIYGLAIYIATQISTRKNLSNLWAYWATYASCCLFLTTPAAAMLIMILVFAPSIFSISYIFNECIKSLRQKPLKSIMSNIYYLYFILLLLAIGVYYQSLKIPPLTDNSAALYIGVPLILSLGTALMPVKSLVGTSIKITTIALIMSSLIFGEGYVCILMSAPLFYTVSAIIAYVIERNLKKHSKSSTIKVSLVVTLFALLSLEGTTTATSFSRESSVSVSKVIPASIAEVRIALEKTPRLTTEKPLFLRIFPYPSSFSGEGLQVGDLRTIKFVAYKKIWWNRVEGDLVMRVTENKNNKIVFTPIKDTSYISHYLKWQSSVITLEPVDKNHTRVTWTLSYERLLDPKWYFGPMQQYAVRLAAMELLDNVATPHS